MTITAPPGVYDILPVDLKDPWKSSYLWVYLENMIRELASEWGFREIRTPLFEKTELLQKGVGDTTDIVTKEMYSFEDRGGRNLTLRPEGTAPAMRAFIENGLAEQSQIHKLFYIAPMFRYERSQAGRYRQHHQFGVESIGSKSPETDAEVIDMAFTLFKRLGLSGLTVYLNSIGDQSARETYKTALKDHLKANFDNLSNESKIRFEKNPLRILDSKDPKDQELIKTAPSILDFLSDSSKTHFEKVQNYLRKLSIPFVVNPLLVRGLDYYQDTVFEITSGSLGSQNSICGGGRYDGLIKSLGGKDLPSFGFGMGLERVLQTLIGEKVKLPVAPKVSLFFIPLGEGAKEECFLLQKKLREAHISAETDYENRKLGKALARANQLLVPFVAIIGDAELEKRRAKIKDMASGSETDVSFDELVNFIKKT